MPFGVASCGASRSHASLNGVNASERLPVKLLEAVHRCMAQSSQCFGRSSPHRASGSKDEALGKPKPNVYPAQYGISSCNAMLAQVSLTTTALSRPVREGRCPGATGKLFIYTLRLPSRRRFAFRFLMEATHARTHVRPTCY